VVAFLGTRSFVYSFCLEELDSCGGVLFGRRQPVAIAHGDLDKVLELFGRGWRGVAAGGDGAADVFEEVAELRGGGDDADCGLGGLIAEGVFGTAGYLNEVAGFADEPVEFTVEFYEGFLVSGDHEEAFDGGVAVKGNDAAGRNDASHDAELLTCLLGRCEVLNGRPEDIEDGVLALAEDAYGLGGAGRCLQ
jgi:hypothetical protein